MCTDAWGIRDHLPIFPRDFEMWYIDHLQQAFFALELTYSTTPGQARPFSIMPLHLLFMVAIQFKMLRIRNEMRNGYEKHRFELKKKVSAKTRKIIQNPATALDIAHLREREIVNFLKVAGLSDDHADHIYDSIIVYRNDKIAHAKGHIELRLEAKINEYFDALETVQKVYQYMNQSLAQNWLNKVQKGEDIGQFFEKQLRGSLLCPRDLVSVVRAFVASPKLSYTQHLQALQKLQDINIKNSYDCSRFKYIRS